MGVVAVGVGPDPGVWWEKGWSPRVVAQLGDGWPGRLPRPYSFPESGWAETSLLGSSMAFTRGPLW